MSKITIDTLVPYNTGSSEATALRDTIVDALQSAFPALDHEQLLTTSDADGKEAVDFIRTVLVECREHANAAVKALAPLDRKAYIADIKARLRGLVNELDAAAVQECCENEIGGGFPSKLFQASARTLQAFNSLPE